MPGAWLRSSYIVLRSPYAVNNNVFIVDKVRIKMSQLSAIAAGIDLYCPHYVRKRLL
jgi:hypothetical protein